MEATEASRQGHPSCCCCSQADLQAWWLLPTPQKSPVTPDFQGNVPGMPRTVLRVCISQQNTHLPPGKERNDAASGKQQLPG